MTGVQTCALPIFFVAPVFYTYLDQLQTWLGNVANRLPWASEPERPVSDAPTLASGD